MLCILRPFLLANGADWSGGERRGRGPEGVLHLLAGNNLSTELDPQVESAAFCAAEF